MEGQITIVGLGPDGPAGLTREASEAIEAADRVFLRTSEHPAASRLAASRPCESFDPAYAAGASFEEVYRRIVDRILETARSGASVVYAVPGDPVVGEATTTALRAAAVSAGVPFRILHAASFIEPCLELAGVDALDGLQVLDGAEIARRHFPPLTPDQPALLGQVYSRLVASDLKLVLLAQYPPQHPLLVIDAAGTAQARTETVPLEELDRQERFSAATAVFVPPLAQASSFESFQETIAHLRAPDGCPWDRQQTHASLRPHLLEETYEALEAIDGDDPTALREELGDLLLQIVLQAQIASEAADFSMADVIAGIQRKLVRRHPHVFGDVVVAGVDEVLHNWEHLKADERAKAGEGRGALDGVPRSLPALAQALEIQERAARLGFDWRSVEGVRAKMREEWDELEAATDERQRGDEVGDLLFAVVNYARWLGVDPEAALRQTNRRFRDRFAFMERSAGAGGASLGEMNLEELEGLWREAKRHERQG
ncbi:MAG TPA: nucleoside triphosphate pyrophosphohydrolase [Anaerolineales bacterium]|nr:nucleoside triphosphate pyrophosphohydrolase [Anaerolineales bacterium]